MAIVLGLSSCNKDDESTNNNTNSIVGKWEWSKETDYDSGSAVLVDYQHYEECGKDQLIFEVNGTLRDVYYEKPVNADCSDYDVSSSYSISGNTLTITEDDGETYSANFTVTNDELKIISTNDDGTVYTSILKKK